MESTPRWEFTLPESVEFKNKLEDKRIEYRNRIEAPDLETHWSSFQSCDLIQRHDLHESFRLLYYKYVILSDILLAYEKRELAKKAGTNGLPDKLEARFIGIDIATSLARPIDPEQFEYACKVISDYLTGTEPL